MPSELGKSKHGTMQRRGKSEGSDKIMDSDRLFSGNMTRCMGRGVGSGQVVGVSYQRVHRGRRHHPVMRLVFSYILRSPQTWGRGQRRRAGYAVTLYRNWDNRQQEISSHGTFSADGPHFRGGETRRSKLLSLYTITERPSGRGILREPAWMVRVRHEVPYFSSQVWTHESRQIPRRCDACHKRPVETEAGSVGN